MLKKFAIVISLWLALAVTAFAQTPKSTTVDSSVNNGAAVVALDATSGSVGLTVTGLTASGATLAPEASNDFVTNPTPTWSALTVYDFAGATHTTLTADGQYQAPGGHSRVRLRVSSTGTGTVTVASFPSISGLPPVALASGGSATAANQATQIAAEQAIQAGVGAIGDAAWSGSGNGSIVAILKASFADLASIVTNTTGASTAVNQTTANTSLASIATNTTGAATAANQTAIQGTVAAGTAATKSVLTGGVFNTALPTLTNGQQVAAQYDSSGRQIVASAPTPITYTYRSGTITSGAVAQTAASSNTSRKTYLVQNPCSATEDLFVRDDGTAATADQNSMDLAPCGSYETPSGEITTAAVSVIAATTGHTFMFKEGQ